MTRLFIIVFCSILITTGCVKKQKSAVQAKHIVATTSMLYDAVKTIVRDKMTVDVIMGPGVDPHLYKATQGDLSKLNKADLIVYNGLFLEGKMSEVLLKLGKRKPTVAATAGIPETLLLSSTNYDDAYDPHVWFDVTLWKLVVNQVAQAIIKLDSVNSAFYRAEAANYLLRLDTLHEYALQQIQTIPEKQRIMVTAHDAFGYFGNTYGLKVEAVQGISTVSDFGLRDIAELTDLIIENQIKAVFVETSVSEKSINALLIGCRERGHNLVIGGSLYSDAMGEWNSDEGTYIGMFRHNVNTIVNALK